MHHWTGCRCCRSSTLFRHQTNNNSSSSPIYSTRYYHNGSPRRVARYYNYIYNTGRCIVFSILIIICALLHFFCVTYNIILSVSPNGPCHRGLVNKKFNYLNITYNCHFKTGWNNTLHVESLRTPVGIGRYTFLGYFCCTLYTHAPVVVLRPNFPGLADRPTVPNHNNMLNYYYYCRLRLYYYYILHSTTVYILYIYICRCTSRVSHFCVGGRVSQCGGNLSVGFWNETRKKKRVPIHI